MKRFVEFFKHNIFPVFLYLAFLFAMVATVVFGVAYAQANAPKLIEALGGSTGTISTLDQWIGTTSPSDGITQRVFGKVPRFTGFSTCNLDTDSNGYLVCGTDAGGTASSAFEIATTSGIGVSQLAFFKKTSGMTTIDGVATTTVTASSPLAFSQPVAKVGGSNSVLSIDTSGAWSGTAGALAANGANCSSGNAPLGVDASGAVESCFDVWTEAENTSAGYLNNSFKDWSLTTNVFSQSALAPTSTQNIHVSGIGTSTFVGGLESWRQIGAPYINATSSTATSTFSGGIEILGRLKLASPASNCEGTVGLASNGGGLVYCQGIVSSNVAGSGITVSGATGNVTISTNDRDDIATSTGLAISELAYYTKTGGLTTLGGVATTTASCAGTNSCTAFTILGGTPITITGAAGTSAFEVATTSDIAVPQVAYFSKTTGRTTLASVATTTLSAGSGLSTSAALGTLLGGANATLSVNDRDDIATTSDIAISQIAYFTKTGGLTTIGSVATGTVSSANTALTVTAGRSVLGGALTLTVSTTTTTMYTGTPGQVLGYTNLGWSGVATTTAGTGLTYTGTAFNVNTSQNIATLSNLTGNGIVYTSGGAGTLNTANFSANTVPYINGAGTAILYVATTTLYSGTAGQVLAKVGSNWIGVATTTAGTGLTYTGSAFNVNTSQNIATLSNLTSNGFVKTSGGVGTLSVTSLIDLAADITGILPVTNGGTGWASLQSGYILAGNNTTRLATTSAGYLDVTGNRIGFGTTTPRWILQVASSTRPQIALSDASNTSNHWTFRSINSNLYLATSSPSTFATSTFSSLAITSGGLVSTYAIQPATSTALVLDWTDSPNQVEYRIGASATTITLINATTSAMWGSTKRVYICNPDSTAGALTWVGVRWIGTAPTQTTTASKCDLYSFNVTRATSTTVYIVAGAQSAGL